MHKHKLNGLVFSCGKVWFVFNKQKCVLEHSPFVLISKRNLLKEKKIGGHKSNKGKEHSPWIHNLKSYLLSKQYVWERIWC